MRNQYSKRTRRRNRGAVFAVAAVVTMGLCSLVLAQPQCAVPRYDPQSTGRTSAHATYNPSLEWRVATGSTITPVLGGDGTLYFGGADKCVYAYDSGGKVKWTYRTSSSIGGSTALGLDGTVYVGATGQLVALTNGGLPLWASPYKFSGTAVPTSVQIGGNGTLYFGTDDYKIYAVNADGSGKWSFSTGSAVRNAVSISPDGSTIYATAADGRVYAVNADNGSLRWKSNAIGASYNCAIGSDGTVYVGSSSGKLYALEANGTQKWTFQAQSKATCAPTIAADGTIYFGSQDMNLYALDASGHQKWHYRTGGPIYSAPTVDGNGTLVFSAWPGTLTAVDSSGDAQWTRTLTAGSYSSVLVGTDGSLYVLCTDGSLSKFSGPHMPEPSSVLTLAGMLVAFGGAVLRRQTRRL